MELYIGGFAQGKLEYVMREYEMDKNTFTTSACVGKSNCEKNLLLSGEEISAQSNEQWELLAEEYGNQMAVFNHFHLWIQNLLNDEVDVWEQVNGLMQAFPKLVIISDEVGNGIVPLEYKDRIFRETTGRVLCEIAKEASRVVRIFCGVGQVIKE